MKESKSTEQLDKRLESFDNSLQLHSENIEEQKKRMISAVQNDEPRKQSFKLVLSYILIGCIIVSTLPLYSSTATDFMQKLLPMNISNDQNSYIDRKISKLLEVEKIDFQNVGISTNPFTINIGLMSNGKRFDEQKSILIPKIKKLLKKENIDDYKLEITPYHKPNPTKETKMTGEVKVEGKVLQTKWPIIVSNIYNSMAGKSTYKMKGISFKEGKDLVNITIHTGLEKDKDTKIIVKKIENELQDYFAEEKTQKQIGNSNYEIIILDKEKNMIGKVEKY